MRTTGQPAASNRASACWARPGRALLFSTVSGARGAGAGGETVRLGTAGVPVDDAVVGRGVGVPLRVGPPDGVAGELAVGPTAPGGWPGPPRSVIRPMTSSATPASAQAAPISRAARGPANQERACTAGPWPGAVVPRPDPPVTLPMPGPGPVPLR